MKLTGAAAGDDLLKTSEDPTGRRVRGMLNNCAGGSPHGARC
jgi:secreted PhoX family phosphatase